MKNRFVVLGSNSFSGSHFVDFLLEKGFQVNGISRSLEPHRVFLPYKKRKSPQYRFHRLDLNHDLPDISRIIQAFKPSHVVNFAAQSMVGESWRHPEHWLETNVVSTVKLHDFLRQYDSLEKYVHISTPEVYGSCTGMVKENTNYHPSTPYAVSRAACDMSLKTFFDVYGFPVVSTRAANVYGPHQQLYRIIPRSVLFFLTGRKLKLHGGGKSIRSFIHIRDVANGTLLAAQNGDSGEIYHLSTVRSISIRALVELVARQMGISFYENTTMVDDRPGKDAAYLLDAGKAREKLGWKDQIQLEQGIEETIGWVRDNLVTLKRQPMDYVHKP